MVMKAISPRQTAESGTITHRVISGNLTHSTKFSQNSPTPNLQTLPLYPPFKLSFRFHMGRTAMEHFNVPEA